MALYCFLHSDNSVIIHSLVETRAGKNLRFFKKGFRFLGFLVFLGFTVRTVARSRPTEVVNMRRQGKPLVQDNISKVEDNRERRIGEASAVCPDSDYQLGLRQLRTVARSLAMEDRFNFGFW